MTDRELDAFFLVQKGRIKTAAQLAKKLGVTRARGAYLLRSLKKKGLIEFIPSIWRIKK